MHTFASEKPILIFKEYIGMFTYL